MLVTEIRESLAILENINGIYEQYAAEFSRPAHQDRRNAIFLSEILCNTYTCLETLFFRMSRAFENHLDNIPWHKDLLRKMRLEIPGVRKALLSKDTFARLDALRRFRHFRRYYYEFDYDWRQLEYLREVYVELLPRIISELQAYIEFLEQLDRES